MDPELDRRLIEIEMRVAYQDDALIKLTELVQAHQKQLYHLDMRFETLLSRFRNLIDTRNSSEDIPNEKPPHY